VRRACIAAIGAIAAVLCAFACSSPKCDDFATMSFDVAGHTGDSCALVLAASSSVELDFAAPTMPSSCDGGTCTRSACTSDAGPTPSYCARTFDMLHDRIAVQLEGDSVSAFVSRLGSRDFTATLTCGGALVVDHERHSVDCISDTSR
jgi:hypothetical protein